MTTIIVLAVLPLVVPALALLVLTLSAGSGAQRAGGSPPSSRRPRVAVLIPAHDESAHVVPTIRSVSAQLAPGDRCLVVADNCSDDTAAMARAAGAAVVERQNNAHRGKGHALAFGVEQLRADPPEVVLVVDADCAIDPGSIDAAARTCQATGRPVQMLNLSSAPADAGLSLRVVEFAMRMKNLVRPLGTQRLGGACHLTGTGMALPWPLISRVPLATGHVAEDMRLGVDLAGLGHAPVFLSEARVRSAFVDDPAVLRTQKTRWEHGHLDIWREALPGLVREAWRQRSRPLAALALDLCIPPLALYVLVLGLALAVLLAAAGAWPAARPAAALAAFGALSLTLAVLVGWWRHGRPGLRAWDLARLPLYAAWKIPVYLAYAAGRRSGWIRTQRTTSGAEHPQGTS